MSDANKTDETKMITANAARYFAVRGFRPVEAEVYINKGWVADIASAASLTPTEAQRLKLVEKRPFLRAGLTTQEHHERYVRWCDKFDSLPDPITAIVEVKVSISDFARDNKWRRDAASHLLYAAIPASLKGRIDVPPHVGLLVQCGKSLRCERPPIVRTVALDQVVRLIYAIALRRDNHTRYERFREFERQYREHENDRINRERFSTAFRVCRSLAVGQFCDPVEALSWFGVRSKLPPTLIDQLRELTGKGGGLVDV